MRRPRLEVLEDRSTPATFTVTTLADDGPGSLRQVVQNLANASQDADTIVFDPSIRGGTVGLSTFTNLTASWPGVVPQPVGPAAIIVTSPITIRGSGETIARAGGVGRLFQLTAL